MEISSYSSRAACVAQFLLMCQFTQCGCQRKTDYRTTHKNSVVLYWNKSVVVTQRRFRAHFQTRWAPSFKTIHKLHNHFNNDGSVLERKHHWSSSVRSLENIDAVGVALQRSPSESTRKAAEQLGISRWSVQWTLKSDLNLYKYKMPNVA
jgi:hypothetical protein